MTFVERDDKIQALAANCSDQPLAEGIGFAFSEYTTMKVISEVWNPTLIPAFAALGGSLVGALGSTVATWIGQRYHDRRDNLAKKSYHREQLYSRGNGGEPETLVEAVALA